MVSLKRSQIISGGIGTRNKPFCPGVYFRQCAIKKETIVELFDQIVISRKRVSIGFPRCFTPQRHIDFRTRPGVE